MAINWNPLKTIRELNSTPDPQEPQIELQTRAAPKELNLLERGAMEIADQIAPEIEEDRLWCRVGEDYTCTFYIHMWPTSVTDDWLFPLLHFEHPLDVALYIQPLPVGPFIRTQRTRLSKDRASVAKDMEDGRRPDSRKISRIQDIEDFLDAVENDITRPYQLMVALTLRASTPEQLEEAAQQLETEMTTMATRRVNWRHREGFHTTMPLMTNELLDTESVRLVQTQGLMACFPFTSSGISHETGVLLGLSRQTRTPIILNRFFQPPAGNVESPNAAIFGRSGSGKSYLAKMEMSRWSYKGVPVIVLDPSGEYQRVCEGLGGQNIDIALDSHQRINPLDFSYAVEPGNLKKNPLRNKLAAMGELLGVMLSSGNERVVVDPVAKTLFDNAMIEAYRIHGYSVEDVSTQQNATSERMPRLIEVFEMLRRIGRSNRDPIIQDRVRTLLPSLARFVGDGPLAGLFDQLTTVKMQSHFINFNLSAISRMGEDMVPMAMHLVLEYLRTTLFTDAQMQGRYGNKLLYIDEAQNLMAHTETARFLAGTSRTCRKYGIGLTVMTQDVGVFVLNEDGSENKIGKGVLNNCSISILLKQHPNEIAAVQKAFNLTPGQVQRLSAARIGEGLLMVGQESVWFSAMGLTHPMENRLFETSVSERARFHDEDQLELEGGAAEAFDSVPALGAGDAYGASGADSFGDANSTWDQGAAADGGWSDQTGDSMPVFDPDDDDLFGDGGDAFSPLR